MAKKTAKKCALSFQESDLTNRQRIAFWLHEYQLWRRSIGKYAWHEDPNKSVAFPLNPKQLGQVIDSAIGIIGAK